MGYVFPSVVINAVKDRYSDDPKRRECAHEAITAGLASYEFYKAGMRSGLFGALIGKALFPSRRQP